MKHNDDTWIGRCPAPECGKLCFLRRKLAKKYLSKHFPNSKMTVYRCPYYTEKDYFHFGHTPYPVARGYSPRGLRKDQL